MNRVEVATPHHESIYDEQEKELAHDLEEVETHQRSRVTVQKTEKN